MKPLPALNGIDKIFNKTYNKACRESAGFLFGKRFIMKKKITLYSEFVYVFAILILSLLRSSEVGKSLCKSNKLIFI